MSKIVDFIESGINHLFACIPQPKPCEHALKKVKLIAHRGAHNHRKEIWENTHEAFERALALDCWGIEFDIRATADGVLMVHHDPTLKRIWKTHHALNRITHKALKSVAPSIPTLEEVVQRYGKKLHLFIELKSPFNQASALKETLKSLEPIEDYHLIALNACVLEQLSQFPKKSLLLVPEYSNVGSFCQLSQEKDYGGVLGHYCLLTSKKIKRMRAAGQVIGVGFVDSKFSLYREVNREIEWIFSNCVETVAPFLSSETKRKKISPRVLKRS